MGGFPSLRNGNKAPSLSPLNAYFLLPFFFIITEQLGKQKANQFENFGRAFPTPAHNIRGTPFPQVSSDIAFSFVSLLLQTGNIGHRLCYSLCCLYIAQISFQGKKGYCATNLMIACWKTNFFFPALQKHLGSPFQWIFRAKEVQIGALSQQGRCAAIVNHSSSDCSMIQVRFQEPNESDGRC